MHGSQGNQAKNDPKQPGNRSHSGGSQSTTTQRRPRHHLPGCKDGQCCKASDKRCYMDGCNGARAYDGNGALMLHIRTAHGSREAQRQLAESECMKQVLSNKSMHLCKKCHQLFLQVSHEKTCQLDKPPQPRRKEGDQQSGNKATQEEEERESQPKAALSTRLRDMLERMDSINMETIYSANSVPWDIPHRSKPMWYQLITPAAKMLNEALEDPESNTQQITRSWKLFQCLARAMLTKHDPSNVSPATGATIAARLKSNDAIMQCLCEWMEKCGQTTSFPEHQQSSTASDTDGNFSGVRAEPAGEAKNVSSGLGDSESEHLAAEQRKLNRFRFMVGKGDISGAVRTLHSDLRVVPITEEVLEERIRPLFPTREDPGQGSQDINEAGATEEQGAGAYRPENIKWEDEVGSLADAIMSSNKTSAAGPTGHRIAYWADKRYNKELLKHLDVITMAILKGKLPEEIAKYAYAPRILAFSKPNGSDPAAVRPVCPECPLIKLTSKRGMIKRKREMAAVLLQAHQFGVGVPAGIDAIIHAAKTELATNPDSILLLMDFINAFNSISRKLMREQLIKHGFHWLIPYFDAKYPLNKVRLASVRMSDGSTRWIEVFTGVFQGDPLGPFFFAMALMAVMQRAGQITTTRPDDDAQGTQPEWIFRAAQLDDLTLAGGPKEAREYADAIVQANSELKSGLVLNMKETKTHAYPYSEQAKAHFSDGIWATMRWVEKEEGTRHLGIPAGSIEFQRAYWEKYVTEKFLPLVEKVKNLDNIQSKGLLLYLSLARTSTFMMRGTHPWNLGQVPDRIDEALAGVVQTMLPQQDGSPPVLSQQIKDQITLPRDKAGLAITSVKETSRLAFVAANLDAARTLQEAGLHEDAGHLATAMSTPGLLAGQRSDSVTQMANSIVTTLNNNDNRRGRAPGTGLKGLHWPVEGFNNTLESAQLLIQLGTHKQQFLLTTAWDNMRYEQLWAADSSDNATKARLTTYCQPGASEFLSAIPSQRELTISNAAYAYALANRLGLDTTRQLEAKVASACSCHSANANRGELNEEHSRSCRLGGALIERHDRCLEQIWQMAKAAGFTGSKEPRARYPNFGNGSPDIALEAYPTPTDPPAFLELAVVNATQPRFLSNAACKPLYAAQTLERFKTNKYKDRAELINHKIHGIALEFSGAHGPNFAKMMSAMYHRAGKKDASLPEDVTWSANTFYKYWAQRIHIALIHGSHECFTRAMGRALRRE